MAVSSMREKEARRKQRVVCRITILHEEEKRGEKRSPYDRTEGKEERKDRSIFLNRPQEGLQRLTIVPRRVGRGNDTGALLPRENERRGGEKLQLEREEGKGRERG